MTKSAAAEPAPGAQAAAAFLAEARPADALEAMLAEQMAAVHEAAMRATERAAESAEHPQIEALYLRQAARLMHLFARQTEALDRRRKAAEDRAEVRGREARVEEKMWRQESAHAKRCGEPAPPPPPRSPCVWPAWPVRANVENGAGSGLKRRGANGRVVKGPRRNGAALPT